MRVRVVLFNLVTSDRGVV